MIPGRLIPHSRPTLGAAEARSVMKVVQSGQLAQGPEVASFEDEMSDRTGVEGAVAVNSGTSALHLGLLALGIGPGDEVLVPSYVCRALLNAVRYTGGTARLVDVDPDSFNIDPDRVGKALTKRSRAVIVPHLFGLPAELRALRALGVPIIEDCAHAIGASYRGKPVGTFGIFSFCSFYATKLMTSGEGGMILSRSQKILDRVRSLREYDRKSSPALSFNYKMTDLQAAIGRVQLKRLPAFIARRKALAGRYNAALAGLPIQIPGVYPDRDHCYYRYVIRVKGGLRPALERFRKRGISCERPVFRPLHHLTGQRGFPGTEHVFRRAISVPLYPSLSDREVERILSETVKVFD